MDKTQEIKELRYFLYSDECYKFRKLLTDQSMFEMFSKLEALENDKITNYKKRREKMKNINFKEIQKREALVRMKELKMYKPAIEQFKNNYKLNCSDQFGILFNTSDEILDAVKEFEKTSGSLVYHVIYSKMRFGDEVVCDLYDFLYVSKNQGDWENERCSLIERRPYVYCFNKHAPWCSECGSIYIKTCFGGVIRVITKKKGERNEKNK